MTREIYIIMHGEKPTPEETTKMSDFLAREFRLAPVDEHGWVEYDCGCCWQMMYTEIVTS